MLEYNIQILRDEINMLEYYIQNLRNEMKMLPYYNILIRLRAKILAISNLNPNATVFTPKTPINVEAMMSKKSEKEQAQEVCFINKLGIECQEKECNFRQYEAWYKCT